MSLTNNKTSIIGVTGGIGCGMTTVAQILAEPNSVIISGDKIAREIVEINQPAFNALVNVFGKTILKADGVIDRRKLGDLAFSDLDKLDLLNKTIRPFWVEQLKTQIQFARQNANGSAILVDAAILLEAGLKDVVDKLVVVTAPIKTRRERIRSRDFLDECQIDQRIAAQIPVSEKAKQADFVIENTGTLEQLKEKINQIKNELVVESIRNN